MKTKEFSIAIHCYYIVLALLFVFILAMMVLYLPGIREFDYKVINFVQYNLAILPYSFFAAVSNFGSANYWLWPRITAAAVMVSHKYYIQAFLFIIMTKVTWFLNDMFIKNLICRTRPCGNSYPGYSFPSGHVAIFTTVLGILIYLTHRYVHTDWWRILLITVFSVLIFLIMLSRMFLNVHFLTDVLAGFFVGLAVVNLYIILEKFFSN